MRQLIAFAKKELKENWRTGKIITLSALTVIFGIMNPLLAKLTPDFLPSFIQRDIDKRIPKRNNHQLANKRNEALEDISVEMDHGYTVLECLLLVLL